MSEKIRVLVVDDSALMRKLIPQALQHDSTIEVVGTAMDGALCGHCPPFDIQFLRLVPRYFSHKGGLMPSFSAVMRAAVKLPSVFFSATVKIAAPGFNGDRSPGT